MRRTRRAARLTRQSFVFGFCLVAFLASARPTGQSGTQATTAQPQPKTQTPVFTKTVSYHPLDLQVRDAKKRFVANLTKDDFDLYEDGVLQKIEVFYPVIGGRAINPPAITTSAPTRSTSGLILPKKTATPPDISGRVFVIMIDDMSFPPTDTPKAKSILQKIRDNLVQDNDLVGIVSSGYSSIAIDLTHDYNHVRFDEAIKKTAGAGMSVDDVVRASDTTQGPAGLRYQAHMAMRTARDILDKAALITDRKKAFIYVSAGYDFDPFKGARLKHENDLYGVGAGAIDSTADPNKVVINTSNQPTSPTTQTQDVNAAGMTDRSNVFAEIDLISELAELIRVANRSNMTIYTIDPRGMLAGPDIGSNSVLTTNDWIEYKEETLNSLHALGDATGGFCICNTNDYEEKLQEIDAQTSDYYMLGYNSTNQDPLKVKRKIEIRSKKPGFDLKYLTEYTLPLPGKSKNKE